MSSLCTVADKLLNKLPGVKKVDGYKTQIGGAAAAISFVASLGASFLSGPVVPILLGISKGFEVVSYVFGTWGVCGKAAKKLSEK
jgi:hypothetical protein